ncbi:MAG: sigma-70 family RNA polymerase sigma factor [Acidobacteria bacterium]|nr:sigma-70 family RNA polymerase sigma factor [Acidobacteriota bacterium]
MSDRKWKSRTYFLLLASRTMRMLLVDRARARAAQKRPTSLERQELEDSGEIAASLGSVPLEQMIDLDRTLDELAQLDERKARVVEMRFFGGLEFEEIAEALEVSVSTVKRDWEFSRTWLFARLGQAT